MSKFIHQTILQFPITAISCLIPLLVSAIISTNVYQVKKTYALADLEAQAKFSNVLKEITMASSHGKDKILHNCFPYASKFARSVIGLIELYVSILSLSTGSATNFKTTNLEYSQFQDFKEFFSTKASDKLRLCKVNWNFYLVSSYEQPI